MWFIRTLSPSFDALDKPSTIEKNAFSLKTWVQTGRTNFDSVYNSWMNKFCSNLRNLCRILSHKYALGQV